MAASQEHVSASTPMGVTIIPGAGATLRIWAPRATHVYARGDFNGWTQAPSSLLVRDGSGIWSGFLPGVGEGDQYNFFRYYGVDADCIDNRRGCICTFLDVLDRLEYLVELGINAVEPLPIVEFPTNISSIASRLETTTAASISPTRDMWAV
jgi:1,4-alpha-glucan branching enzyme